MRPMYSLKLRPVIWISFREFFQHDAHFGPNLVLAGCETIGELWVTAKGDARAEELSRAQHKESRRVARFRQCIDFVFSLPLHSAAGPVNDYKADNA